MQKDKDGVSHILPYGSTGDYKRRAYEDLRKEKQW